MPIIYRHTLPPIAPRCAINSVALQTTAATVHPARGNISYQVVLIDLLFALQNACSMWSVKG
jgi:hypothetical protein